MKNTSGRPPAARRGRRVDRAHHQRVRVRPQPAHELAADLQRRRPVRRTLLPRPGSGCRRRRRPARSSERALHFAPAPVAHRRTRTAPAAVSPCPPRVPAQACTRHPSRAATRTAAPRRAADARRTRPPPRLDLRVVEHAEHVVDRAARHARRRQPRDRLLRDSAAKQRTQRSSSSSRCADRSSNPANRGSRPKKAPKPSTTRARTSASPPRP